MELKIKTPDESVASDFENDVPPGISVEIRRPRFLEFGEGANLITIILALTGPIVGDGLKVFAKWTYNKLRKGKSNYATINNRKVVIEETQIYNIFINALTDDKKETKDGK